MTYYLDNNQITWSIAQIANVGLEQDLYRPIYCAIRHMYSSYVDSFPVQN